MVLRALSVAALAAALTMTGLEANFARAEGGATPAVADAPMPPVTTTVPAVMPTAPGPLAPVAPPGEDLFYNFYVGGGGCVPAAMYPSPRPVPAWVGHTYITYQPLLPHEFLYRHHRIYDRWNPGSGWTRTTVHWGYWPGVPTMFSKLDRPY